MSEQIGKLVTCTRCDEWIFLRQTGEVGLSNYSGPGSIPTYEDLPKEWMYVTGMGHLCPVCAERFINLLKEFFGEGTVYISTRLRDYYLLFLMAFPSKA